MKTGYKVLSIRKPGEQVYYPPMVANPGGAPTPIGEMYFASDPGIAGYSKTGRPQVAAGGNGTARGRQSLAHRPGIHIAMDAPYAPQFIKKDGTWPWNFVWAECRFPDEIDYTEEAMRYGVTENGSFRHAYAGLPYIPKDGYYRYRTNPNPDSPVWAIAGAALITRILPDKEVAEICAAHGIQAPRREVI